MDRVKKMRLGELTIFTKDHKFLKLFQEMKKDRLAIETAPNKFKMIYPIEELDTLGAFKA